MPQYKFTILVEAYDKDAAIELLHDDTDFYLNVVAKVEEV